MYLLTLDSLSCIYSLYMANTNMSKGLKYILEGKGYEWQIIRHCKYDVHVSLWTHCLKREREMQIYIMFTSLSNLSYVHRTNTCLFLLKNHTLKDEIIISAQ